MDTPKFIVSLFAFVFIALLFPTLQDSVINATNAGNLTGGIGTTIMSFPLIFLAVSLIIPIYYAFKEGKE